MFIKINFMNTKSKWSIGSEVKSQSGDSFILLKR